MNETRAESISVPTEILGLIARFNEHRETYQQQTYNETQVRREFIDPFFAALGWDVDNRAGIAEAYKDVIHEDAIKIGGATKAPDYCFRIGGTRKFFVEAKKPAIGVANDPGPAYQVRRYAWTSKLPLSIVTDFEEFAVYDCRIPPKPGDKATVARILYCTFDQYAVKWAEIAGIFSKDAVLRGSFDKYAESNRRKKGTAEVDAEFLKEIEEWRESLAKNFALRNENLSVRDLNFAVERTIDRVIFLRMCEDRGIEPYGRLQGLLNGTAIYGRLAALFREADDKYNAGLFYFRQEADRGPPDELTLGLALDDKVLKQLIARLYYPESPYEFSVLPTEILGQVYEQFLGKVITLTAGHRAKIEEKPEVRKAGGVYYTPTYIVDYIVKNTVGKLLEGKTPADVGPERETKTGKSKKLPKGAKMLRVLDPACGSGSFLLGAYQHLLDWHRDYYVHAVNEAGEGRGPDSYKDRVYQGPGGHWRLTIREKKRILLNNIYGVDIDAQAVEVTKLSLLLKVLEGETAETIGSTLRLFHERALPDLSNNIKCGNSLIGPDFYEGRQMDMFDEEERRRINVFDWRAEFPDVFPPSGRSEISNAKSAPPDSGFDAVIGNPPYLYSAGQENREYFERHYRLSQYQTDFYVYFLERAISLTSHGGYTSFIVSDAWLKAENFSQIRNHLLISHRIALVAVFDYPVFKVALENSLFCVVKAESPSTIPIVSFKDPSTPVQINYVVPDDALRRNVIDPRHSAIAERLVTKLELCTVPLSNLLKLNRGIHAYRTDGYGLTKFGKGPQTAKDKELESYHADRKLDETYLPELKGKDVFRFHFVPTGRFVSYGQWLAEPREPAFFIRPRITLRKILSEKLHGTFLKEAIVLDQSLYVAISPDDDLSALMHVLGLLLSRIGAWYLRTKYAIYDTLYPWYTKKQLAAFPIRPVDSELVRIVDRMLILNKSLAAAKTDHDKTTLQRQIAATDKQIDQLVYQLYGLTDDEIRMVEEATTN